MVLDGEVNPNGDLEKVFPISDEQQFAEMLEVGSLIKEDGHVCLYWVNHYCLGAHPTGHRGSRVEYYSL